MDLQQKIASVDYWYHKIELPGGTVTPGWSPICADMYYVPADLTGMMVLDIGAWDGYWTWEALKRGAREVIAIDDLSDTLSPGVGPNQRNGWQTFDICREAFGFTEALGPDPDVSGWTNTQTRQQVKRLTMSVYDLGQFLTEDGFELFDLVLFFGTIYHTKHPFLALETISQVCKGLLYVETAALDDYSPYHGGVGHGFNRNEAIMEFYPNDEYGDNPGNWWAPTLQCLGLMVQTLGFKDVSAWPLTESPQELPQCRGFVAATMDPEKYPVNRPKLLGVDRHQEQLVVKAVMSVPRLGFTDNMSCTFSALFGLKIPLINIQGAFWGQCLERGIQQLIDEGADLILTIDYDTVYFRKDVEDLIQLMYDHPEAAAVVPIQAGRGQKQILTSLKTKTGQPRDKVPLLELIDEDVTRIASGHFGLTLLRAKDLMDLDHPWFLGQPNCDGQWGPGRIDDDIYFWKKMERAKKTVLLANRVVIGHLELLITYPDEKLQPNIHALPSEIFDNGKPADIWK